MLATRLIERALTLNPQSWHSAWGLAAGFYLWLGRFETAARACQPRHSISPPRPNGHLLGVAKRGCVHRLLPYRQATKTRCRGLDGVKSACKDSTARRHCARPPCRTPGPDRRAPTCRQPPETLSRSSVRMAADQHRSHAPPVRRASIHAGGSAAGRAARMTEQRRLAAIVSADVAGYSRLMGRDESGTLAALKALRQEVVDPAIAMHGGRIVKTTATACCWSSRAWSMRCAARSRCRRRWPTAPPR